MGTTNYDLSECCGGGAALFAADFTPVVTPNAPRDDDELYGASAANNSDTATIEAVLGAALGAERIAAWVDPSNANGAANSTVATVDIETSDETDGVVTQVLEWSIPMGFSSPTTGKKVVAEIVDCEVMQGLFTGTGGWNIRVQHDGNTVHAATGFNMDNGALNWASSSPAGATFDLTTSNYSDPLIVQVVCTMRNPDVVESQMRIDAVRITLDAACEVTA